MDTLTREDALICSKLFSDYFNDFNGIGEYMRSQKLSSLKDRQVALPGYGLEEYLFDDFTMHPDDMDIETVYISNDQWDSYLKIISSHTNMTSIPGRSWRLAVREKNSGKWIGFIRLGSPMINCKPRNIMLGSPMKVEEGHFNKSAIMGFVIVPAQPFGFNYLGGKLLAGICCSHFVREELNKKYNMNTCLFETTSLYGSSKQVSQYDGMKPYIRYKGLTDSNFIPSIQGDTFIKLKEFVESKIGELIPKSASSRKLKLSSKIISVVKASLEGEELKHFKEIISKAEALTEQKRYYISNYGIKNFVDVVNGTTDILVKDENYEKFELDSIISWWKKKAANRYETLKSEGRLRTEQEVWSINNNIDIIR